MRFSLDKNLGHADRSSLRTVAFCCAILAWALLFAANANAAVRSSANFSMNSDVLDSGAGVRRPLISN